MFNAIVNLHVINPMVHPIHAPINLSASAARPAASASSSAEAPLEGDARDTTSACCRYSYLHYYY